MNNHKQAIYLHIRSIKLLTFIAVVASVGDAAGLLVQRPVGVAAGADRAAAAGRTSDRTGHALVALLVAEEPVRAGVQAATLVRESARPAQDALRLGRPVAGHAGRVAVGAAGKGTREGKVGLEFLEMLS